MKPARILVVDDEPGMVRLVGLYLRQAGYDVLSEGTGAQALVVVERRAPDLVILDVGLPDVDGFTVARQIRASGATPIIMLTARADPRDRLTGFAEGVDDYVAKPFHPDELVARVRAVLRRTRAPQADLPLLVVEGLEVDTSQRTVLLEGELLDLRPKEFDLLATLMRRPGHVFSREHLLEHVWGYDFFGDGATVDVHIWRLRGKLGETRKQARFIHTVWGVGYTFRADPIGT